MQKYLMGIDRGTTNEKAGLYHLDGTEAAVSGQACEEVKSPRTGYAEQNMERIWQDTARAIRGLWDQGFRPEEVIGVGLSGQGGGMFLVDESGVPVREGIVSLDSRVACEAEKWKQEGLHREFLELWKDGNSTLPQALLYWMKEKEPDQYRKCKWMLQCKDWIRYRLTGSIRYEITDASNGFLIDKAYAYQLGVLDEYGISEARELFPELIKPWDLAGTVTEVAARDTGLLPGTPVCGGGHDVAMAAFGSGCVYKDQLSCVLGTWGLNLLLIEHPHPMMEHYGKIILSAVPDMYLFMNGGSTGSSLEWFMDRFCEEEKSEAEERGVSVYEVVEERILEGENASRSSVICHPYTEPLLMMPGYENAQAGFYGMTARTTKGQLLRAVLEGIAIETALFLEVSRNAADRLDAIYLTGGGASNRLLAQMIADAARVKVRIMDIRESGCRGAALTAGIAVGVFRDHAEAGSLPIRIREEFVPDESGGAKYIEEKMKKSKRIAKAMEEIWNH